jgi:hypothetical protein
MEKREKSAIEEYLASIGQAVSSKGENLGRKIDETANELYKEYIGGSRQIAPPIKSPDPSVSEKKSLVMSQEGDKPRMSKEEMPSITKSNKESLLDRAVRAQALGLSGGAGGSDPLQRPIREQQRNRIGQTLQQNAPLPLPENRKLSQEELDRLRDMESAPNLERGLIESEDLVLKADPIVSEEERQELIKKALQMMSR